MASTALKAVIDRPRPPIGLQLVLETDPSFPSGHVTGTAALLGIVVVCVSAQCSRTVRACLAACALISVLVSAATRLYLGVHWLTDVIAGVILAAAFVTAGAAAFGARHARTGSQDSADSVSFRSREQPERQLA